MRRFFGGIGIAGAAAAMVLALSPGTAHAMGDNECTYDGEVHSVGEYLNIQQPDGSWESWVCDRGGEWIFDGYLD